MQHDSFAEVTPPAVLEQQLPSAQQGPSVQHDNFPAVAIEQAASEQQAPSGQQAPPGQHEFSAASLLPGTLAHRLVDEENAKMVPVTISPRTRQVLIKNLLRIHGLH